jgi:2-oxoglutarate dehydrogenase E2 component (dihydrolipoamide succinyltransferase)
VSDIRIPKLSNNDTEYVLVEWAVEDGKPVHSGDPVATVETSKAAEELVAEADGYIRRLVEVGALVTPGQPIATLSSGQPQPPPDLPAIAGTAPGEPDVIVTAPAQALLDELGIPLARVYELGIQVVRRADVEALATVLAEALADAPRRQPLSRVQQAVGRAVSTSHSTIPAAYTAVKMDIGRALTHAAELTAQVKRPIGLAEMFVAAVAGLHERFPLFFAAIDGDHARLSAAAHVGVTVDLGNGLYVPVVRDAARLGMKELATRLMEFRLAAMEARFRPEDLDGANIAITLHTDPDVCLAIPFVFPGQVCALAVTAPQSELVLDGTGAITARTVATIGLAYDHRLINGRDAAAFLNALKEDLP